MGCATLRTRAGLVQAIKLLEVINDLLLQCADIPQDGALSNPWAEVPGWRRPLAITFWRISAIASAMRLGEPIGL